MQGYLRSSLEETHAVYKKTIPPQSEETIDIPTNVNQVDGCYLKQKGFYLRRGEILLAKVRRWWWHQRSPVRKLKRLAKVRVFLKRIDRIQ